MQTTNLTADHFSTTAKATPLAVATSLNNYNVTRNITGLHHQHYRYKRERDIFAIACPLIKKITGTRYEYLQNSHFSMGSRCDLYHHFNCVSFSKKPWVATFEFTMPRWYGLPEKRYKTGVQLMASEACRQLIAMSEHAKAVQSLWLNENFPDYHDAIMRKVKIVLPPQPLSISESDLAAPHNRPLTFTIVGNDFFRKGGREILRAFDKLSEHYPNIDYVLNVVSSLQIGDYATHADEKDSAEAVRLIEKNQRINWLQKIPNTEVMALLTKTDIALLPSYADTFGYSVLEAQAVGCAMITTNIQALPEINNNRCGWVIDLPLNRYGEAAMATTQERQDTSAVLEEKLFETLHHILTATNSDEILSKQRHSVDRIRRSHDPTKIAYQISTIYDKALS